MERRDTYRRVSTRERSYSDGDESPRRGYIANLFGRPVEEEEEPTLIEEPEQRSSLLSALLSPEIVRRRVRDVFRIRIPSPALVEPDPVIETPRPKAATRIPSN